jgi:hypothetical protein
MTIINTENENRFNIDFFEFTFLVEACIPPTPIARSAFWQDVINKYYNILTPNEQIQLFDWIQKNPKFDLKNKDCKLFYDRFNPDNQYIVTTKYLNKIETHYCFKCEDRYYKQKNTSVLNDYITDIVKIEYNPK